MVIIENKKPALWGGLWTNRMLAALGRWFVIDVIVVSFHVLGFR